MSKISVEHNGIMKRKGSTSAKVSVPEYDKRKEQNLLDIHAEVIMSDIPPSLVINWDQTAFHLVPVSAWTISRQGAQSIRIAGLDNKREITVIIAVTLAGE